MFKITILIVTCVLIHEIASEGSGNIEWDYKEHGPDEWPKLDKHCKGKMQSPINLDTQITSSNSELKPIVFNNYDETFNWNLTNNGHTVKASIVGGDVKPSITGSNYEEEFFLDSFHFHWGYNPSQGSEHTMNGKKYPMEMHLVHKSASGKLAVIGFFFVNAPKNNRKLNSFLSPIGRLVYEGDVFVGRFNPFNFFPSQGERDNKGYFRYTGSLTTPPCTEGIIWTVYRAMIPISKFQLRSLYSNKIEINFREVQPLNDRTLESSF